MVWDIATGVPVISLEDPIQAAAGSRNTPGKGGAVKGLAWVMANPARLAIVLSGGMVLVWDVQGKLSLAPLYMCMAEGILRLSCAIVPHMSLQCPWVAGVCQGARWLKCAQGIFTFLSIHKLRGTSVRNSRAPELCPAEVPVQTCMGTAAGHRLGPHAPRTEAPSNQSPSSRGTCCSCTCAA